MNLHLINIRGTTVVATFARAWRSAVWRRQLQHRRNAGITKRSGLTLVELLVVITIIVLLAAGSLPTLIPALEQRRRREAARLVDTALSRARNQAVANGRPAGVLIQRMKRNGRGAVLVYLAEVPPPYAGDTIDAKVTLTGQPPSGGTVTLTVSDGGRGLSDAIRNGLVRVGDRMQFNYQGPLYKIIKSEPLTVEAKIGNGEVPWTDASRAAVPYQVFRQPTKTAADPVPLPAGTVIDLGQSREGRSGSTRLLPGLRSDSQFPIIITFASDGSLDRIYHSGGREFRPRGAVHLLIGKLDKLGSVNPQENNLQDMSNFWVSIQRQTGLVTTAKMSKGGNGLKFAEQGQSAGGL